ncbi:MAG: hypothetical protein JWR19_3595 [Pedosphaera sp.]|nr:hypothetical protein [Pedosphaera sp.]
MTTTQFLFSGWDWNPVMAVFCLGALLNYFVVFRIVNWRRVGLFLLAVLLFVIAICSPLNTLARNYLFSAHMAQHLLLLLVVPALWLLGLPRQTPTPLPQEAAAGKTPITSRRVVLSWTAGVGAMWLWHLPALCNAAAGTPWVQQLQTVSLLAMGTLFWWPVLSPQRSRLLAPLAAVGYLFTACMACTLLGIYLTFSPVAVCAAYHHPQDPLGILPLIHQGWGLTPAVDQQLGGLLMWVPACLIYLSGVIGQLTRWYVGDQAEAASTFAAIAKPSHPGNT